MPSLAEQLAPFAGGSPFGYDGEAAFKPAKKVDVDEALAIYAPWEQPFAGVPSHARKMALACEAAGLPVHLRDSGPKYWGKHRELAEKEVGHLAARTVAAYLAQLWMLVPEKSHMKNLISHPFYPADVIRQLNGGKIFYTVWERQWVSQDYARILNQIAECWVPCEDNREMLLRAGVKEEKVHVVPCPYHADDPLLELRGKPRQPGPVRFYHVGKWEPRKEQDRIIGAFLTAFQPGEACLMLKTSAVAPKAEKLAPYPGSAAASLKGWLDDERVKQNGWTIQELTRYVMIFTRHFSEAKMHKLHETADVYVTLSRGEAVDIPALDAKLAGNLLLYTPSGGPTDFAGPDDVVVPTTGVVEAHPFYGWEEGATYYDYDFEAAVAGMQHAKRRIAEGDVEPSPMPEKMDSSRVGELIKERVQQVAGT